MRPRKVKICRIGHHWRKLKVKKGSPSLTGVMAENDKMITHFQEKRQRPNKITKLCVKFAKIPPVKWNSKRLGRRCCQWHKSDKSFFIRPHARSCWWCYSQRCIISQFVLSQDKKMGWVLSKTRGRSCSNTSRHETVEYNISKYAAQS